MRLKWSMSSRSSASGASWSAGKGQLRSQPVVEIATIVEACEVVLDDRVVEPAVELLVESVLIGELEDRGTAHRDLIAVGQIDGLDDTGAVAVRPVHGVEILEGDGRAAREQDGVAPRNPVVTQAQVGVLASTDHGRGLREPEHFTCACTDEHDQVRDSGLAILACRRRQLGLRRVVLQRGTAERREWARSCVRPSAGSLSSLRS